MVAEEARPDPRAYHDVAPMARERVVLQEHDDHLGEPRRDPAGINAPPLHVDEGRAPVEVEKLVGARPLTPSGEALTPSDGTFDPPFTPHLPPFDPPLTSDANTAAKEEDPDFELTPPKNAHQGSKKTPSSYSRGRRSGVPLSAAGAD